MNLKKKKEKNTQNAKLIDSRECHQWLPEAGVREMGTGSQKAQTSSLYMVADAN